MVALTPWEYMRPGERCVSWLQEIAATSAPCWCRSCRAGHDVVGLDAGWYDGCDFGPHRATTSAPATSATSGPRTWSRLRRRRQPGGHLQRPGRPPQPGRDLLGQRPRGGAPGPRSRSEAGVPRYRLLLVVLPVRRRRRRRGHRGERVQPGDAVRREQGDGRAADLQVRRRRLQPDATCATPRRTARSPRLRADIVVNNLTGAALTRGEVRLQSDGSPWRPLVHAEDISRAFLAVLEADRARSCTTRRSTSVATRTSSRSATSPRRSPSVDAPGHLRRGRLAGQARLPGRLRQDRRAAAGLPACLDGARGIDELAPTCERTG